MSPARVVARLGFSNRRTQRTVRYGASLVLLLCIISLLRNSFFSTNSLTQGNRKQSKIQQEFPRHFWKSSAQNARLRAVRREFLHAWNGYQKLGWLSDSLKPISGEKQNQFCGWSATLIDSLDTLYLMGLSKEFDTAVKAAVEIDFSRSTEHCRINFFESTIRYLGGMMSAYDLSHDQRLLPKIMELGNILHQAFDTTSGVQCTHCWLDRGTTGETIVPSEDAPLADVASFYLEFTRLWQLTGDEKYLERVKTVTKLFNVAQDESSLPGMWPERVNVSSIKDPSVVDTHFMSITSRYSLGALSDSAYEYLPKAHLLLGRLDNSYAKMWRKASQKIQQFLLFHAYIPQWKEIDALFAGIVTKDYSNNLYIEARTEHLACFAGGMFALASRLFGSTQDLRVGEALTNGCVWAYQHSPTGIMPETFNLLSCPPSEKKQCAWNRTLWESIEHRTKGFPAGFVSSLDERYVLRPEAIESVFVLYRITGDPKWREHGWKMFQSIIERTRTRFGHASLVSTMELFPVDVAVGKRMKVKLVAMQADEMESFWLAETLKYFYLLFSDPDLVSLDDFVLNTEAHPLRLTDELRGFPSVKLA